MNAVMTGEEAELAYRRLAGIRDRLASKLLTEIESHDGLRYLTDHRHAGHTLRLWRELQSDIVRLGAQYQALARHVGSVEALRARGGRSGITRLERLSDLLHSPMVRLRADGTPADETTGSAAETITLDALCARVEALGDDIRAQLQAVDVAAKAVLPRLGALADALSMLAAQRPGHDDLVERYRRLRALALDDPIGWAAEERELRRLETAVSDARAALDRRDQLRGRLAGYRAKAGRLGIDERTEVAAAYRVARDQLWRAPCDLDAAAEAVWRYQDLVVTRPRHDGGVRG
jgi:hypothetical protein